MSVTAPHLARRRRRSAALVREEILRAAAATFARRGFHGTTMQDIAAAAGYTPPTLYSYFRNKAAIFDAILQLTAETSCASLEEPLPGDLTFRQRVELFLRRHLAAVEANRDAFALFFAGRTAELAQARRARNGRFGYDDYIERLSEWIRRSARRGDLRHDPRDLAHALVGLLYAFVRRSLQPGFRGSLSDQAPLLAEIFLGGALRPPDVLRPPTTHD
ncbi:MAG TPA: TetR/AcrR family transcriptional regulator [Thermoanaerobaculia bacterium]|nr:TetR/AcrR family transcriptional regulator [Thermoanaerobaculia bacterium]